jgi:predicted molibdopterin-dependent oxidoreductase YjgC
MSAGRLFVDGQAVAFEAGDTVLSAARRAGADIPTLCDDSRLEPAGACRTCLVEVEGQRRLLPSCITTAADGLVVSTVSERVKRHRSTLFSLYLSDHPVDAAPEAEDELLSLAERHGASRDWMRMESLRASREADRNPYIHFDAERCILCARCTRYCDEVEGVAAITLAARGPETTISTVDGLSLLDSTCELCGGCIDVCPTGALREKLAIGVQPEAPLERVRTTCGYCGVGCQLDLLVDRDANEGRGRVVRTESPEPGTTTNDGNLCVKGRFAYTSVDHEERLTVPLVRREDGSYRETSWDEALSVVAAGLQGVAERHGADSLGFISSSRCTSEENYLVQKLSRAVFGTHNVHQCSAT